MNFENLLNIGYNFTHHNVMMRAALALLTSLFLTFIVGKRAIYALKRFQKHGQPIREDGPQSHIKEKAGTPTMGGLIIIFTTLISVLFWGDFANKYLVLCIAALIGFGVLGFLDDYKKLKQKSSGGVTAKAKFLIQLILAFVLIFCVVHMQNSSYSASVMFKMPVIGNMALNLGLFYYLFASIVVVGASNAVNLTDGLDGLAIIPVAMCAFCFWVFAIVAGDINIAQYFGAQHIEHSSEIAVMAFALLGSSIGFLWYNAKPAQVFMGDVGSLSLGAVIGLMSVITKREITLAIVGGLFVIETISVILQVMYFRKTGGKRLFKMAPLHHHFEKKGWPESKVVVRFWIIACIFMILGFLTL